MREPAVSAFAAVEDDRAELLPQVHERNSKANLEAARQAEAIERKRQESKQRAANQVWTPANPDARVRIVPRTIRSSKYVFGPKWSDNDLTASE